MFKLRPKGVGHTVIYQNESQMNHKIKQNQRQPAIIRHNQPQVKKFVLC